MENKTVYSFLFFHLIVLSFAFGVIYTFSKVNTEIFIPKVQKKQFDYNQLLSKWQDFKPVEKQSQQSPINYEITLTATSVGIKNFALIKLNGKSYVVSTGQTVEGIKIQKIDKDKIIVFVNNERKTIKIGNRLSSEKQQNIINPVNLPPLESILPSNKISKSELERLTSDPGIMFTQIRLVPFVENNQTKGFRFDWIQEGSLFQKMGIQVGDVLVAINNQQITSGEDAFRILQIIRNEPNFKVSILRNGKMLELNYFVE
jgi:general secretion pathway protein C